MIEFKTISGLAGWASQTDVAGVFDVSTRGFRSCIAKYIPPGMAVSSRGRETWIHMPSLLDNYLVRKVRAELPTAGGEVDQAAERLLSFMGQRIQSLEQELARLRGKGGEGGK